jgi:hypothetical protein
MNNHSSDPLAALRDIDPQPDHQLSPGVSGRLWARIEESIVTDTTAPAARPSVLTPRTLLFAVSGAAVAAALAVAVLVSSSPAAAPTGPSVPLGDAMAMCLDAESAGTIADRDFAFDGTVTAIGDEERVTFTVNRVFVGDLGGETTLVAGGMAAGHLTSNGGPGMEVGGRYLVSGDEDYAWNCGFTQTYSDALAAEWEATAR